MFDTDNANLSLDFSEIQRTVVIIAPKNGFIHHNGSDIFWYITIVKLAETYYCSIDFLINEVPVFIESEIMLSIKEVVSFITSNLSKDHLQEIKILIINEEIPDTLLNKIVESWRTEINE